MMQRALRRAASLGLVGVAVLIAADMQAQQVAAGSLGAPSVSKPNTNANGTPSESTLVARQRRILGNATQQSGKVTFTRVFDKLSWTVLNPEVLKGLEGLRIEVTADVYRDPDSIRVLRVRTFPIAGVKPTPK